MRARGNRVSPLLLGLFVSLSIVAVLGVAPVYAKGGGGGGTGPQYTCSVAITYSTSTFTVKTTVTASSGYYLPGPSETDNVKAYINGVLYNTQSVRYSVSSNTSTQVITVPVSTNGSGGYTFQSTILNSKGSQLAGCSGTYTL